MGMIDRWFRRRPSDDDMREELEAHVAMRAEHDGVDARAARRRLGNVLQAREAMRRVWIAAWWDALRQDAHYTWRSWRRRPGFALGAILVLALGLGASTALFAALDRVLFKPLPYADPDRLVSVGVVVAPPGGTFGRTEGMPDKSYVQMWSTTPAPFEAVTAMDTWTCEIAEESPEGVRCGDVDHNFLRVLGVHVVLGRDFAAEDDVRAAPRTALISHALWVRRYGADPGVLERTVNLDTARWGALQQVPIIGVLPPEFEMPVEAADILLPSQLRPFVPAPFVGEIMPFARLKPGVTPERAEAMLAPQLSQVSTLPGFRAEWRVRLLRDRRAGDAARAAWLLIGAVAVFLLIACVNVTNLMLARVGERRREFALRAAIGAGTIRLARLALAESLLLSIAAGASGLVIALALLRTFVAMAPPGVPGITDAAMDLRVYVVAILLMIISGVAIGLWPALSVLRVAAPESLRSTSTAPPGARPRVRFALVTAQIALTLALLVGSTLLLQSLWNVVSVPLGFDAEHVITLTAGLSRTRYPTAERATAFFDELLERARSTPGVIAATLSDSAPPPRPPGGRAAITVEGRPTQPNAPQLLIGLRWVTPDYFKTFRISVVKGTTLKDDDAGEPTVVLNESAERTLFAGESSVGRRVRPAPFGFSNGKEVPNPWFTVVGVTPDVRNGQSLTDEPAPEAFLALRAGTPGPALGVSRLTLRTTAAPSEVAASLRQITSDIDPRQLVTIQTGDELLTLLTAQPRFIAWLLTAFATLALLLAAAGLYSVASYLVTQRRRDIGVRIAIGASPRDVARQVVGEAGRWIIGGAVAGAVLGWMGTRALQSQLYQVEALDPWSWTGALLALAVVLMMAVFRPAYRAAHVDPVAALRAD